MDSSRKVQTSKRYLIKCHYESVELFMDDDKSVDINTYVFILRPTIALPN